MRGHYFESISKSTSHQMVILHQSTKQSIHQSPVIIKPSFDKLPVLSFDQLLVTSFDQLPVPFISQSIYQSPVISEPSINQSLVISVPSINQSIYQSPVSVPSINQSIHLLTLVPSIDQYIHQSPDGDSIFLLPQNVEKPPATPVHLHVFQVS